MIDEKLLNRYKDYDSKIIEYMGSIIGALDEKYSGVPDGYIISLDLLAMNLKILFDSMNEIKEKGMTDVDKYRGEKKSSAMQAFWAAQNYIHKILASFGFTPASRSRIRENQDKADVQKFLEEIVR